MTDSDPTVRTWLPAVYRDAVNTEVDEVVRGEFGETVAQMIDRGMNLNERYGDDAEQAFYEAVTEAWKARHAS